MATSAGSGDLRNTATWAVVVVCFTIILISILLEKLLNWFQHVFTEKKKMAMVEALAKVKDELMILGFISLLLNFTQKYLAQICVPEKVANTMWPCKLQPSKYDDAKDGEEKGRRLLWEDALMSFSSNRRFLYYESYCSAGKEPLIGVKGLHQLHIFIFFLAVYHVLSSGVTMAMGRLKIREWKYWEQETSTSEYEFSTDPSRFHYVQDNTFVRQHASCWNNNSFLLYVTSFFRQFFKSVLKEDYLMLRHGFIAMHLAPGRRFDFQKYIKRSLEDDFKVVAGISPILWASAGILLLINVEGWYSMFWASVVPLVIILSVGTKLQAIISKMALEISNRDVMVQGVPVVSIGDRHFWFKSPKFILFLIHFTLFQNAFQIVYFFWVWYNFGMHSCFHERIGLLIARVCVGVFVLLLCSYVTLPLYALVSQLGSSMKKSIFDEHTAKAIKRWHHDARKHHHGKSPSHTPSRSPARSPCTSPRASTESTMHRHQTLGHSATTARNNQEQERSLRIRSSSSLQHRDIEMGGSNYPNRATNQTGPEEEIKDFSFVKPAKNNAQKDLA